MPQYIIVGFIFMVVWVVCVKALAARENNSQKGSLPGFLGYLAECADGINDGSGGDSSLLYLSAVFVWILWPFTFLLLALMFVVYYAGKLFNI